MAVKNEVAAQVQQPTAEEYIQTLVDKAKKAQEAFMALDQEQVDKIVHAMALAGLDKHMYLAKLAVEETGRGVYEDKITKNIFATEYIWHGIKYDKTVGVIEDNVYDSYQKIAEPVGVVMGITPVTNPTSTTMFKALISIKTRNPIIFGFHPSAQACSAAAAKILHDAAVKAGAPENCIQWIEQPTMDKTNALMNNDGVALILATGGSAMVKAAYSCGKPALGVGPGNVPAFIEKSANIDQAVNDIILSKTFDNGMICASEQAIIIEEPIFDQVKKKLIANGCYFVNKEEAAKLTNGAMNVEKCAVNPVIVGQSAVKIAEMCGIQVPAGTKILIAELEGVGTKYPLSAEKLSPVLACYKVKNADQGIERAAQVVEFGGMGHSSAIHSNNEEVIMKFSNRLQTGRILVNSPSTHGAIGDIYNTNIPSLTLGCGSYGRNSVSQNVTAINLINVKRVNRRIVNMQWFKLPEKIYFEKGATQYLAKMPDITRVAIITDPMMVKLGYVERVEHYLRQRQTPVAIEVFSEVEPDPSTTTVEKGTAMMNRFQPDCIIALGGGSSMDAAKGMWLFYEHPDADFDGLKQKFLDIRKRVYKFPKLGIKAKFVAIPTTSGTGSEVTSFAVITDKTTTPNTKYPLADYELTPDVAIIDPEFVYSLPRTAVADTGMDVLTHAIEAYVSILASDYSDGLAIKAIQLVFQYLEKSALEADKLAREKMHNASTLAGMAFANAFLGINHSLAHKWGGQYHTPHGRTNAILLPHVIRYNAKKPSKFASFPKYSHFVADERYAEIARILGLPARTTEEGINSLINAIRELNKKLGIEDSFQQLGIDPKDFEANVDYLADKAFEDQCTTANPKLPLVSELADVYRNAFYGKFDN
ncbi:bifunctional acetaldehyde-CoA/alcohol dehydrogenase [Paenibacillus sp. 7124]|uniref:Aldehyde-alcohol dehydrogenase n=1 Tax=Paenibacillus apii TaxID=1850370 RepID=A0A6M1PGP0_9BACL|nr:bifunctional acetaldehyde-CoA/alcohol dehydrogenase [Paenibacillus apii]NGM81662.1 bifunctional acetaldehyde-CoA/alcohol dehydrogenase [Paenibacillus apii]NJJ41496.1 bifunctional acetaldehyde-CoA/alcohol dehydrogenase [Paenibacillus apii]